MRGEEEGRGGNAEAEEQQQETQERLEALREAQRGRHVRCPRRARPAPRRAGLGGRDVLNPSADDWEPAIAADPNAPYVYVLATRYAGRSRAGQLPVALTWCSTISTDGGTTWGPAATALRLQGLGGQFDPIIEVVPDTGARLRRLHERLQRVFIEVDRPRRDVVRSGEDLRQGRWNDKPMLATSDDGQDVYVSSNGPTGGDPWIAQSHDAGATWTQTRSSTPTRYYFAFDGDVLAERHASSSRGEHVVHGAGIDAEGQVRVPRVRARRPGRDLDERRRRLPSAREPARAPAAAPTTTSGTPR